MDRDFAAAHERLKRAVLRPNRQRRRPRPGRPQMAILSALRTVQLYASDWLEYDNPLGRPHRDVRDGGRSPHDMRRDKRRRENVLPTVRCSTATPGTMHTAVRAGCGRIAGASGSTEGVRLSTLFRAEFGRGTMREIGMGCLRKVFGDMYEEIPVFLVWKRVKERVNAKHTEHNGYINRFPCARKE